MAALSSLLTGCASQKTTRPSVVLVHGAWHGAWCWDQVAQRLRTSGFDVHVPTLPGLGEDAANLSADITLDTHIKSVADLLVARDLRGVVLVGHSYGGAVISGVADRQGARLRRLIYLDALLLENGESLASLMGAQAWEQRLNDARMKTNGLGLPALPPAAFGVVDPAQAALVQSRLTPQPINTFAMPLRLTHPLGNGVPKVYVDCNEPAMTSLARHKQRVRSQAGWTVETMRTGHDAMITSPAEVADLIVRYR